MKYLLSWATLLLSLHVVAQTTPQPAYQAEQATHTLFTDITATAERVIAVGQHGTIVISDDAQQWQQAQSPVDVLLTSVFFIDNNQGWACGHDATILNTQDGGQSWQVQQFLPELDKPCLDITFMDAQQGIAVGAYGMYFVTQDGGQSWQKRFLDSLLFAEDRDYLNELKAEDPEGYESETASILPHFNRIATTSKGLYIVGEMGLIAHSSDGGQTWQREEEIYQGSFFDITEMADKLYVAGLRGNAFSYSEEDGWQQLMANEQATMNSMMTTADKQLYIFGNSAVIYHLDDASSTQLQSEQLSDGKAILNGVLFNGQLILATEAGIQSKEFN
ncbi:YCF48-related protein [Pseudoalteromonas sp. T1lg88]|uniref:YCF48-related protein n=1 Tax=Pseudoalteromonas sp. T1lg88 TaxID=2077104 RepID=UPI000CF5E920|nr:YCF48-related protein [Pseudoalteromonas sp. T1lg88]